MTKKLIFIDNSNVGNLHCDACGHDLEGRPMMTAADIGTPCPKCGADMLTKRDFDASMKMFALIDWFNKWFGWLGKEEPPQGTKVTFVKIHDGKLTAQQES